MKDSRNPKANGQKNAQPHVQPADKISVAAASVQSNRQRRKEDGNDGQENIGTGAAASFLLLLWLMLLSVRHDGFNLRLIYYLFCIRAVFPAITV